MPTYGPWIQDPDYDLTVVWRTTGGSAPARRAAMLSARGMDPQPVQHDVIVQFNLPISDTTAQAALNEAKAAAVVPWESSHEGNAQNTQISRGYEILDVITADYRATAYATIARNPWLILPGVPSASSTGVDPFYYYPGDATGEWVQPESAVDVEFEGDGISQWLAVRVDAGTQLDGINEDQSDASGEKEPVTGNFITELRLGGDSWMDGPLAEIEHPHTATTPLLGQDVDLTPLMSDGGLVIYTKTSSFVEPRYSTEVRALDIMESWRYGWWIETLRLVWRVRPPRYRWVYEGTPYRRTSHRHDSLAGGATRNYPPSRALQTSNRVGGGYL